MAKAWPRVVNREEWRAIDGARLAIGWNERKFDGPEDALYRGISTFVFESGNSTPTADRDGLTGPGKNSA